MRLPAAAVRRLRQQAGRQGNTLVEAVRTALENALSHPERLVPGAPSGPTTRLGALPMPAELAQRLTEAAGALGVSVAEVVRRAVVNTFGGFATVANLRPDVTIDALLIRLWNAAAPCCENPMGLDNIVLR